MLYKNLLNQCENIHITNINITEFPQDDDLSGPGESQFPDIARFSIYDSMEQ